MRCKHCGIIEVPGRYLWHSQDCPTNNPIMAKLEDRLEHIKNMIERAQGEIEAGNHKTAYDILERALTK